MSSTLSRPRGLRSGAPRPRGRRSPRSWGIWLTQALAVVVLLGAWQLLSGPVISPLFVSSPSAVVGRMITLAQEGVLLPNAWVTFSQSLAGFAVGAVAGVVSQTVEILVNQTTFKVFRVHDPAGSQDYPDPEPALEHAQRRSRELALAAARRAGATDPHVETRVTEKLAQVGPGADYLAEAVARSTATGRPLAGHADASPHIG